MSEKLQKILATAGLASRRQIEEWIKAGRVSVNGKLASIGDRASPEDKIRVDGHEVKFHAHKPAKCRVLLYHKPEGQLTTRSDPEGRATVFETLPKIRQGRWIAVGRLDINTSGLLLMTTDGELANRLMHPSHEMEREYAARVMGQIKPEVLVRLQKGVMLEDGLAHFESIQDAGGEGINHWYTVVVKQGRNRLVRRLWESQDLKISRLIRIRYGTIALPRYLKRGKYVEMEPNAVAELLASVGLNK